jgi:hypothetical protein
MCRIIAIKNLLGFPNYFVILIYANGRIEQGRENHF